MCDVSDHRLFQEALAQDSKLPAMGALSEEGDRTLESYLQEGDLYGKCPNGTKPLPLRLAVAAGRV